MDGIYFREFCRMKDEINERDSKIAELEGKIAELQTELSNEEWINEQSRKEIDRLNEQIKSTYIGDERSDSANINIKQVDHYIDRDDDYDPWHTPPQIDKHTFDILADVTIGGRTYRDIKLDWLNTTLGNLNKSNVEQSEVAAELRLDLEKARAEISRLEGVETLLTHYSNTVNEVVERANEASDEIVNLQDEVNRLNGLLDKREESAYTAMSEREKAEEFRNELAELKADYQQLMMYYSSQRGSSRHMEAHIESLKEDLSAAREQRNSIQRKHDELVTQLEELVKENDEY